MGFGLMASNAIIAPLVYLDAIRIGAGSLRGGDGLNEFGPRVWTALSALDGPFILPLYLWQRAWIRRSAEPDWSAIEVQAREATAREDPIAGGTADAEEGKKTRASGQEIDLTFPGSRIPRSNAASGRRQTEHTRVVYVAIGLGTLVAVLLLTLWQLVDVLLVIFAGIFFAIFLRGLADLLGARTGLGPNWSLVVVIFALLALLGGAGWALAGNVAAQTGELARELPRALAALQERLEDREWGQVIIAWSPSVEELVTDHGLLRQAPGILSRTLGTTLGIVANVVIVLVLGLYIAAEWGLYARGVLRLVPPARRPRAVEVMGALRETLQWWIIGKVVVMAAVAILTGLGFWLLGVPLALTLGLLAGLFEFIPYIGPVLGFAPAILLSLTKGPELALYVAILWVVVQSLESYLLTPIAQRHAVSLAPAVTIAAQVVLTVLFGPLGLLLATPLAAAGLVVVKMLYVEDALGDRSDAAPAPSSDDVRAQRARRGA